MIYICVKGVVSDRSCTMAQMNGVSLSISALLDRLGDLQQHVRECECNHL